MRGTAGGGIDKPFGISVQPQKVSPRLDRFGPQYGIGGDRQAQAGPFELRGEPLLIGVVGEQGVSVAGDVLDRRRIDPQQPRQRGG